MHDFWFLSQIPFLTLNKLFLFRRTSTTRQDMLCCLPRLDAAIYYIQIARAAINSPITFSNKMPIIYNFGKIRFIALKIILITPQFTKSHTRTQTFQKKKAKTKLNSALHNKNAREQRLSQNSGFTETYASLAY